LNRLAAQVFNYGAGMVVREQGMGVARAGALAMALALTGCRDHPREPVQAQSAAPPTAQGSVNPDAGVTRYACVDGSTITAGYPDPQTAVVTYKDHAYTLKLARSASGARYTGYGLQWWTKGAHAAMASLKPGEEIASAPGVDCAAAPTQPAANPATRT
jgi:membrane-bound inhibitor of C-type lysozyme